MGYQLGVDIGTSYSAAAVNRGGAVEVVTLTPSNPVMPSVVLLKQNGEVLVGETAVRRGIDEPTRVARAFKRRLGDPTPLVLGGTPYGAESLMAHLLTEIVRVVSEREGAAPDRVVLTHPANYGPYKLDQMREVARLAGLDLARVSFVTEPEAAAISYAATNRVEPGEVVAVYDFGGGTFDAALVRRDADGFSLIGRPEGMDRLGGIDIDAAILEYVDSVLGSRIEALDPNDRVVQSGVARLNDDCRLAKEALSTDSDTTISVSLPGLQDRVPLSRAQLEAMIRPRIHETIDALVRAVATADLDISQVGRVLLVGGSSRIPLVAELVHERTGLPVSLDAHPKFAIATGAAAVQFATGTGTGTGTAPTPTPVPVPLPLFPSPASPAVPAVPAVLAVVTGLAVEACAVTGRESVACAADRDGGAMIAVVPAMTGVISAIGVPDAGGFSFGAAASTVLDAAAVTLGTSTGAPTRVADALELERTAANVAMLTIATTANAIAPIAIAPWPRRVASSLSAGANVTGGANSGANAPPPLRFMMSSGRAVDVSALAPAETSARMSMSADDSVTVGAEGAGACFDSAASEKSTLLSLRSPVSGVACALALVVSVLSAPAAAAPAKRSASRPRRFSLRRAYTSPLGSEASAGKESPHRLQRTFTRRPSRRSVAMEYWALQAGHVSFMTLQTPGNARPLG